MAEIKGRVFVTGAAGFIGSHVVGQLLDAGYAVTALVHYNAERRIGHLEEVLKNRAAGKTPLETVFGDIRDARLLRDAIPGHAAVFHLAALIGIPYSYDAPDSYVATNISGTVNVLEACRDGAVPLLIHTSTSEVYGTARTTPMDETHPLQAQSPYAATKIAADKMVESYIRSFDLPAVTIRPFNTYGPRQSLRAVIPTIICQALSKKCDSIKLGALDPVRDLTFVADTARAYIQLLEAPMEKTRGGIFNLGSGEGISIGNLANLILNVMKSKKPVVSAEDRVRPSASEVQTLISNNTYVRKIAGWEPRVGIEDGLLQTVEWLKKRIDKIDPEVYVK